MLSIITASALVEDHVSVLDCPAAIVAGAGEPELGELEPGLVLVLPVSPTHPTIQKLINTTNKQGTALQVRANIDQLQLPFQTDA